MMLQKLTLAACALLPIGMLATAGGAFLARKSLAQDQGRPAATSNQSRPGIATKEAPKPVEVDPLIQQLLAAARQRFETQKAFYEQGRITLDRFVDACQQVESAELLAAKSDAERTAAKKRFVDLLKEIERREQAELTIGRGTRAEVAEIVLRRIQAEVAQKTAQQQADDIHAILDRLNALERRLDQLQRERAGK
jgi:hypothetical protein